MTIGRIELLEDTFIMLVDRLASVSTPEQASMLNGFRSQFKELCEEEINDEIYLKLQGKDDQTLMFKKMLKLVNSPQYLFDHFDVSVPQGGTKNPQTSLWVTQWVNTLFGSILLSDRSPLNKLRCVVAKNIEDRRKELPNPVTPLIHVGKYNRSNCSAIVNLVVGSERTMGRDARATRLDIMHDTDWFICPVTHQFYDSVPINFYIENLTRVLEEDLGVVLDERVRTMDMDGCCFKLNNNLRIRWEGGKLLEVQVYDNGYVPEDLEREGNPLLDIIYRHCYWQTT